MLIGSGSLKRGKNVCIQTKDSLEFLRNKFCSLEYLVGAYIAKADFKCFLQWKNNGVIFVEITLSVVFDSPLGDAIASSF